MNLGFSDRDSRLKFAFQLKLQKISPPPWGLASALFALFCGSQPIQFLNFDQYFLQMVSSLQNMYTFLQKLAVGLEQVVLDQSVYDGRFMEEFNEAEFKLKTVS